MCIERRNQQDKKIIIPAIKTQDSLPHTQKRDTIMGREYKVVFNIKMAFCDVNEDILRELSVQDTI